MAEASLLSQKAALQEQENFKRMLQLQKKELDLRKEEAKQSIAEVTIAREQRAMEVIIAQEQQTMEVKVWAKEVQLGYEECSCTTKLLQKMMERLCPEEDPAKHSIARKRKLDDLQAA